MCAPTAARLPHATLRHTCALDCSMMSDYDVQMIGDGNYEFEVMFKGPEDSALPELLRGLRP